jgi:hypothetical protein
MGIRRPLSSGRRRLLSASSACQAAAPGTLRPRRRTRVQCLNLFVGLLAILCQVRVKGFPLVGPQLRISLHRIKLRPTIARMGPARWHFDMNVRRRLVPRVHEYSHPVRLRKGLESAGKGNVEDHMDW